MDAAAGRAAEQGRAWAHLVGIGGRGMSGLAQLLHERGFAVSGSDWQLSPAVARLRRLGVRLHAPHAPRHVPPGARILVYAPEVERHDPERLAATRLGLTQASLPHVLERLMARTHGVAIAGARGASAVAAMVGCTLVQAGLDPTVIVGTAVPQLGGWGRLGAGPHCVVEALPARGELVPSAPALAVVLNLEPRPAAEHAAQVAAVHRFAASVPRSGYVLGAGRNALIVRALEGIDAAVEHLSLARGCAWWGGDLREERGRYRFRAYHRGRFVVEARLQVPGRRNVLNALAAVAVCARLAVPADRIKQGLEEFAGLERGLESRGSYRGVTLVDDEAPDPWAVAEALAACRQAFGRRRLWSVVRPETPAAWAPFASAFAAADCVLVAEGGHRGRPSRNGEGAWDLVHALASAGVRARWVADLAGAVADLEQHLEPGDVLVTLGAGDVGKVADAFTTRRRARDCHGR